MKLEDLVTKYGTYANAFRTLGMGSSSYAAWRKSGFIPINTQMKIEQMTNGDLVADMSHVEPYQSQGIKFRRVGNKRLD